MAQYFVWMQPGTGTDGAALVPVSDAKPMPVSLSGGNSTGNASVNIGQAGGSNVTLSGGNLAVSAQVPGGQASTANSCVSASNAAGIVSWAAPGAGQSVVIPAVAFGYNATPAATGTLTINEGSNVTFSVPVSAQGAGFEPVMWKGTGNTAGNVTLSAGGANVTASVSVLGKRVEPT